jgi:hypothetical protein
METKVRICDDCKKSIKFDTCKICSKDLCEDCVRKLTINISNYNVAHIRVCKDCYTKVTANLGDKGLGEDTNIRIGIFILGELRKLNIVKGLAKG